MDFVAYDLETTGIQPETDSIIEIGAVRFVSDRPVEGFSILVNPGCPIPRDAVEVHGITDDMVAGKPVIADALGPFAEFCGDLTLVAHNARFDFKFLSAAVAKHKGPAPAGITLDSYALAKKMVPGLPNYRLDTLARHFKLKPTQFHRAQADAACCGMIFICILGYMRANRMSETAPDLMALAGHKELRFPKFTQGPEQLGLF